MAQNKPILIYVGDPMCSWCYGFSPEFSDALEQLDDKVEFEMVMGGLRAEGTETMAELGDFLKHHWEEVNSRSGQPFKYELLKDKDFVYNTEPACRAVRVVRKLKPESELDFFKAVQTAFYYKNHNTSKIETYLPLAEETGIDSDTFKKEFTSAEMKNLTRQDFENASAMGVTGFPSVVLKKGNELFLIANGYAKAERVVQTVNRLLEK